MMFANRLKMLAMAAVLAVAAPAAASAANYEGVFIPGSAQLSGSFFRVNVASGQVAVATGAPANYTIVAEAAPLPAGDYHLFLAMQPETPDGKVWWSITRMDGKSGQ